MNKNILIIAPHPDDETLGCGGMIALRSREGYTIHIVVLSDGANLFVEHFGKDTTPSPAEISSLRKQETERTVALLGGDPGNIQYLNHEDGTLADHIDKIAAQVAAFISGLKPEQVFCPDCYEEHPDHNAANVITKKALELTDHKPELWEYFLSLKTGLTFDDVKEKITEVDISEVYELKKQALGMFDCHHKVVVEGQTEPLIKDNFQSYLDKVEKFIVNK